MPIAALAAALVTLSQGSPSEPANPAPAPLAERALVERRGRGHPAGREKTNTRGV